MTTAPRPAPPVEPAQNRRRRDSAGTQARLLAAALRLFTTHGYSSTTVRAIAHAAGVNVSLVNRYFGSKQGLYAAAVEDAARALERSALSIAPPPVPRPAPAHADGATGDGGADAGAADKGSGFERIVDVIGRQAVQATSDAEPQALLLLVRPADDAAAEAARSAVLSRFARAIAAAAGGDAPPSAGTATADAAPEPPESQSASPRQELGAELVLAFAAGVAMLRTSPGLEGLNSASRENLLEPMRAVVAALLGPAR